MTVRKIGNSLDTPIYEKGVVIQNDGYGLLTSTINWQGDLVTSSRPKKGDSHPYLDFMKAFKVQRTYATTDRVQYKVDYVGIASTNETTGQWESADMTQPNISGVTNLQTDTINSHPHFFDATVPSGDSPDMYMIAGHGTGTASAPIFPPSTLDGCSDLFVGLNGAHFQFANGVGFKGFKDPAYPAYYGRGNYLAPVTSLSGIIYVKSDVTVRKFIDNIGHSSLENYWWSGGPNLVPTFMGDTSSGTPWEGPYGARLLLANVNFEEYGQVYKCHYTVRINMEGYPRAVHPLGS